MPIITVSETMVRNIDVEVTEWQLKVLQGRPAYGTPEQLVQERVENVVIWKKEEQEAEDGGDIEWAGTDVYDSDGDTLFDIG